jgi:sugar lactone lactonase YvrE
LLAVTHPLRVHRPDPQLRPRRSQWRSLAVALMAALTGLLATAERSVASIEVFASGFGLAMGVAVDPADNVYVTDLQEDVVRKFDPAGNLVRTIGGHGSGDGQFDGPLAIATAPGGEVYVSDTHNGRVQKFSPSGGFLLKFGAGGNTCSTSGPGSPRGVGVDTSGDVFVTIGSCVRRFDSGGGFETGWGGAGQGPGQLDNPNGVAVDRAGDVYVADIYHRVQRFTRDGTFLTEWGKDNPIYAGPDLVFDDAENLYVAFNSGRGNRLVERRSRSGELLGSYEFPETSGDTDAATDSEGRVYVTDGTRLLRVDPSQPDAALTGPATPVLTGGSVDLDASGSSVPFGAITDYRWDVDGDGAFERDTGTDPTTSVSYQERGERTVRVRVTAPSGKTATAEVRVDVRQAPPAGVVGVTINNGAQFTNTPDVFLYPVWPAFASNATVSNDGGFAGAQTFRVDGAIPWHLDASGPERLPKTVYLRFDLATQTFQDDIILDQTPPLITAASEISARQSSLARSAASVASYRVSAKDNASGVEYAQFAREQSAPATPIPYARTVSGVGSPRWLRVQDGAGNWSVWRAIGRPRLAVHRQRLKRLLRGLALRVTCPHACRVNAKVTVSARVARHLHLRGRTLGARKARRSKAGVLRMRIVPARHLAQRAVRLAKLTVRVRATVSMASGTTRLTKTATLRR